MKRNLSLLLVILCLCVLLPSANADIKMEPASVVTMLESLFTNSEETQFEVSYDQPSEIYYIYVQQDNIALASSLALTNDSYKEQWSSMRTSLSDLCTNAVDLVKTLTSSKTANVAIFLRNDMNPDKILLGILNSIVVFDVVDGTDLLGS